MEITDSQFEYNTLGINGMPKKWILSKMNEMGARGWEFITKLNETTLIFKRNSRIEASKKVLNNPYVTLFDTHL